MPLDSIYPIPIDDISISVDNVRHTNSEDELEGLAASIKRHGQLQPIVLSGKYGTPPYSLVSGQRRYLACKKILRREEINAVFIKEIDHTKLVVNSLVENMQRLNLSYEDTSRAITHLFKIYKNVHKVCDETGLSVSKVNDFLLIDSQATEKMKTLLKRRSVTRMDVKRALRAAQNDIKKAEALLEYMANENPTPHEKRRIVEYGTRDKKATADKILREALKPQIDENILVRIPLNVREGFARAAKELNIETDELAAKVIADWVESQGFNK